MALPRLCPILSPLSSKFYCLRRYKHCSATTKAFDFLRLLNLCKASEDLKRVYSLLVVHGLNGDELLLGEFFRSCFHLDIENSTGQKVWQELEFVFGWIYVLEMVLKVYAFGFENYWRDGQNQFDFIITVIIVVGETVTFASPQGMTFLSNGEWIRYLLLARMLRLLRILMHVKRYRAFIATFLTLVPSLMPYLGTIFCVLCIYCSIGVQVFGGIVNVGNPKLEGTELAEDDYLLFNFNDYPNGMVTLFNLLVMGNWQVWMQSYRDLTGTSWSLIYFISFYLITILLLLNLVVAFVLEAFFAEMDIETSETCEGQEEDSETRKDRPRSRGTKTRSQRVDLLLHHMLSSELTQTCSNA